MHEASDGSRLTSLPDGRWRPQVRTGPVQLTVGPSNCIRHCYLPCEIKHKNEEREDVKHVQGTMREFVSTALTLEDQV